MENTAHEILVMLRARRYATYRATRLIDRALVPQRVAAFCDAQHHEAAKTYEIARAIYQANQGGAPQLEEERNRVVSVSTEREEFVTFSDGYVHWWPQDSSNGALSSWHLRVLADELDRRNRVWDARVRKALSSAQ